MAEGIGDARSGRRLGSCRNDDAGAVATRHPGPGSSGGVAGSRRRRDPGGNGSALRRGPLSDPHRECAKLHLKSLWLSRIRRASRIGPERVAGARDWATAGAERAPGPLGGPDSL